MPSEMNRPGTQESWIKRDSPGPRFYSGRKCSRIEPRSGRERHCGVMDRVPPQRAALLLGECAKPVVGEHLIERVTMRVIERDRSRPVFTVVHDQFEGAAAEFVVKPGPVALDPVPGANRGERRAHAGMPVKNRAPGIEAKRPDIAHVHDVTPPWGLFISLIALADFPIGSVTLPHTSAYEMRRPPLTDVPSAAEYGATPGGS